MAYKTFQKGASVFTCDCCGRRTRHTTQDRSRTDCAECFDLAGLQCMEWDGEMTEGDWEERDRLYETIKEKGGNMGAVMEALPNLFERL